MSTVCMYYVRIHNSLSVSRSKNLVCVLHVNFSLELDLMNGSATVFLISIIHNYIRPFACDFSDT